MLLVPHPDSLYQACVPGPCCWIVGCCGLRAASFLRELSSSKDSHLTCHYLGSCPFPLGTDLSQLQTDIWKPGSLASLEPLMIQSSLWDEVEARLRLNPSLCLAFPLALGCVPHSLLGFKRQHSFTVSSEQESLSQALHQQKAAQDNYDPMY